jgi:phage tail protein X
VIVIAQDGETLDALVWRTLGRTAGLTEAALAANPAVAAAGAVLAGGTRVDLTAIAIAAAAPPRRDIVSLWD